MIVAPPPADLDFEHLRDDEQTALASFDYYARVDSGYSKIQGTKPQTIGYPLDDSPAGLAAWIVEKFRTWSDCDGDVERRFTKDQLLDNIMLYWLTATAHSAGRLYYEAEQTSGFVPDQRVEVPVGCRRVPQGDHPLAPPLGRAALRHPPAGPRCPAAVTSRRSKRGSCWSRTSGSSSARCGSAPESRASV